MKRPFFGNPDLLARARQPGKRHVLDWQEWHQLLETSNSISQLKNVWAQVLRHQSRIHYPPLTTAALHEFERRGSPQDALLVFDSISGKDFSSWIIALSTIAFSRCFGFRFKGSLTEAVRIFENDEDQTQESLNSMLAAYAQNRQLQRGKYLFDNMSSRDHASWNTRIASFAVNGELESASETFNRMPKWDLDSWTGLLAAYAAEGEVEKATVIFEEMPRREALAWNIKMACGAGVEAFREMQLEGVQPDKASFVCLLLACQTNKGGRRCFWLMCGDYDLQPRRVHYSCMLDLLNRSRLGRGLIRRFVDCIPVDKNWPCELLNYN